MLRDGIGLILDEVIKNNAVSKKIELSRLISAGKGGQCLPISFIAVFFHLQPCDLVPFAVEHRATCRSFTGWAQATGLFVPSDGNEVDLKTS